MDFGKGTVFVLGAGFTRAVLPNSPLLVDDYDIEPLLGKYKVFPDACEVLKSEVREDGKIDMERLMTRLEGKMPYDFEHESEKVFDVLLSEVKQVFMRRLDKAKRVGPRLRDTLKVFAGHCLEHEASCITFNYDDVLDEALWQCAHEPGRRTYHWDPDDGYGFFCKPSERCIIDRSRRMAAAPVRLLKLHGSVNWRIQLGSPRPYGLDAILHHEDWWQDLGASPPTLDPRNIEPYLENEPFIVPPILTKSELTTQPVLRFLWSAAYRLLRDAGRVVFIGYSLPVTDIAAGFLFRESLRGLWPGNVRVVALARDDEAQQRLLGAYRNIVPKTTREQFCFKDAREWINGGLKDWVTTEVGEAGTPNRGPADSP